MNDRSVSLDRGSNHWWLVIARRQVGWQRATAAIVWAIVMPTLVAGCAASGTAVMKSAVTGEVKPSRRMLVVANVVDQYFTQVHYFSFQTALTLAMKECGVEVEHLRYDNLDLDWQKTVNNKVKAFGADSMLTVRNAGGGRVIVGSGGTQNRLNYEARLRGSDGKEMWRARAELSFLSGNIFTEDKGGETLARKIATQMREDKLVDACKVTASPATTSPPTTAPPTTAPATTAPAR